MINLIPILLLGTFTNNTNNNGYNYKSNFQIQSNVTVFNIPDPNGLTHNMSLNGAIYFEGDFYCNNSNNYMFNINDIGYTLDYYYDDYFSDNIYASASNVNFTFTNAYPYLDFNIKFDFTSDGVCNLTFITDYGAGGNDIVFGTDVDSVYWDNLFYDTFLDGSSITTYYRYDFLNDNFTIDLFNSVINKSLSESNDYGIGYNTGYNNGYTTGYDEGYGLGESTGYDNGLIEGYSNGYSDGYFEGAEQDETATAIMSGIVSIGFIPINFFLAIFNWEVFGINIAGFVSSILSVCVLIIVIKHVLSTNGD